MNCATDIGPCASINSAMRVLRDMGQAHAVLGLL
jgi:hypothetical protein